MCLLILAKGGSTPSKKSLRIAAKANPDGFGFAIIGTDNRIHRFRSMDIEETITAFFEARKRFPKGHAIFHLRITTHGATNIDNCHPFVINDDVVMGHNGMLPIKEENGRSDTRIFAEDWLPEIGVKPLLDDPEGVQELEKFIGYSKLAFLNVGDELNKPFYIINEKLGHWKNGVWYSNYSYEEPLYLPSNYKPYTGIYSSGWTPPDYDDDEIGSTVQPDYRNYDLQYEHYDTAHGPQTRWSSRDFALCNITNMWVPVCQADDYDLVEWECGSCCDRTIYSLADDEPLACPNCEQCYYCDLEPEYCTCAEDTNWDDATLFGGNF